MNHLMRMNLQHFAGSGDSSADQGQTGTNQASAAQAATAPQIDYEKIAQIVSGKQSAAEDSVLKGYFKQQGLSQEEMTQAIQAFKDQKAATQPDVSALQGQLTALQAAAQQAEIDKAATLEAVSLGLDAKTIPYVLKIADFNEAVDADGKVNNETIKNVLNKVLEDIPQFKPVQGQQKGFQIGSGGGQQNPGADENALKKAFGL